jgi:hypothetical protein
MRRTGEHHHVRADSQKHIIVRDVGPCIGGAGNETPHRHATSAARVRTVAIAATIAGSSTRPVNLILADRS